MKSTNSVPSFGNKTLIKQIVEQGDTLLDKRLTVCGWIKTVRRQKRLTFISLSDGTTLAPLQLLLEENADAIIVSPDLDQLTVGSALHVEGILRTSPAQGQRYELHPTSIVLVGACDRDYPLQKKGHSFEFLRTLTHLRPRSNLQGAVARLRSRAAYLTHTFFQERDFLHLQSPILTSSDCEGGGELFQVTTLDLDRLVGSNTPIDYHDDFFSQTSYLTVSGQLHAEAYSLACSNVYTFGPTFRAEQSHTTRHLAEFWMIEPEIAFADLEVVITLAQDYIQTLIGQLLTACPDEFALFDRFVDNGLIERLQLIEQQPAAQLTYTEAIDILERSTQNFDHRVEWGSDLQTEHERYLCETYCRSPLIITHYPKQIKAFYMRDQPDGKTVDAFDILVPNIGEIVGGSQREERFDHLRKKMEQAQIDLDSHRWYLDLRRYGTAPHGGFGVGFERFLQLLTGLDNIRELSPFPRTPGQGHP